ncbi:MAG: translocation/assembly module TamB domain-containing protein, partial [Bacteroidia bacterium]|nr:translocation/assembly module TamB domain-containing protein [Bacteroidia bacterium]
MLRKVSRIFFKSFGILALVILLLGIGLYFGIQSYTFQTWLGKRAGSYLSSELGTEVNVNSIQLDFFSEAHLSGVLLLDKHRDTLFYGNVSAQIKNFDYKLKKLHLQKLTLKNSTARIIKYKSDSTFNYGFLVDYFSPTEKDTTPGEPWDVSYGDLVLDNVAFTYRNEKYNTKVSSNINFDNIALKETYGTISGLKLLGDTIIADIANLRTNEQCGFKLQNLSTHGQISARELLCEQLYLKTPNTLVKGKIDFKYNSWDDYSDFLNKVELNSVLEDSTYVGFSDIATFASDLNGLKETVRLSGKVKGYVSDLILNDFKLAYGNHTRFNGNLSLSGLPDISTSYLHFNAKQLSTSYNDIVNLPAWPLSENKKLTLPIELKRLGTISYRGKFDGFINDFTTYGKFTTGLGNVDTKLSIKLGDKTNDIAYTGKLSTENFNLGTLVGQNDLNGLSLNCEVKGKGASIATLDAILEGDIKQVSYNNYTYHNIKLDGNIHEKVFSGLLLSKDPNADFDFNGTINFTNKVPEMDFISTINNLRLNELHFTNQADSGSFSSQIFININGDNIDNLSGQINFDNTIYKTKTKSYKLSTLNLLLEQAGLDKKIKLNSGYINGIVRGNYNLSNLKPAFEQLLYSYYPSYFKKPLKTNKYNDNMVFRFTVKKFNAINELLLKDWMLSPGSSVDGNFSAAENKLNLQFNSAKLTYKSFAFNDLMLIVNENSTNNVLAEISSKSLDFGDSLKLENFNSVLNSMDKNTNYSFDWDNLKLPLDKGEIKGHITYENEALNLINDKISITVNDSTWRLIAPSAITFDKDSRISVSPLGLVNHLQNLSVAGTLSNKANDSLTIITKNILLQELNPLLAMVHLDLKGSMSGNISLSNADNNFAFNGQLNLSNLVLNKNDIGELSINTRYNTGKKNIKLSGYTGVIEEGSGHLVKNISFDGYYYLDRKDESIDVNFEANPANIKLLNPLLEGILTINEGFVIGKGRVHGSPDNIKLDGALRLTRAEVKVDYTNVVYKMAGEIEIMPDQIRFSDLLLREKNTAAPQGTLNGNIFHNNFNKIQLDYDITYRNMLVLNTTQRENKTYYGKVYGSGNMGIYGFLNNLHMVIVDTTTRNSKFYLPLDGPAEISEEDFVQFVKHDTVKVVKENSLSGFNLDLSIYATPNASVQIILDQQTGDVLNAQGQGELFMKINTLGKFEMFGDYIITNGDYLFTLENVINKKFDIEAGSSISWSGDPFNADIDVVTSYKQRASVAPLLNDTSYKGRFPVDCKLLITGKLFQPLINFQIDFPNIDATAKARINNVLSDEVELNRQVFSFLLFRSFVTPQIFNANGGGVTAYNAAASTGSELLSNRVSEFLNSYFG